jgi:FMN-dependent NADH-azoreductase
MKTLLQINTSILGEQSHSSALTERFVDAWLAANPDGRVIRRDLGREPVPHLDGARLQAISTPADQRTPEQQAVADYADALVGELRDADIVVLGLPLYNFGVPSALKAWIDHVARAGVTFRYTANGPEGLLADRPFYLMAARGGIYAGTEADLQSGFLRQFLGFIGIDDVHFVYAEGLNLDAARREAALAAADQTIRDLVEHHAVAA